MTKPHKSFLAIAFIFFVTCLIFFKIFLKGLYPIPGDLLVSFYFPWYSGGWEGYNPWTTRKELLGADSIRQIYLWKEFAANQIKKGELPLWNPYTFSGQPLSANFQSSVYYPLNIFYFLTNPKNAWILLIVTQPFLGGIFIFLAARSFSLSNVASLFTAVAFMFSSYLITWMENGNIAHSYIWLPLAFWSINRLFEKQKLRFAMILMGSMTLSILGGHPQTAIYLYLAAFIYFIYKIFEHKQSVKKLGLFIIVVIFSFGLSAIQLIPTLDFYRDSPISLPFAKEVFDRSILPYKNLITFFASDFFGHPAADNFWSQTYGDFTPYFGVVPLIFALWAIFKLWSNKFVKFAAIISSFFILSAVKGPITYLIKIFQPPLIDSTTPSRFISISIFFLIILAGIGLADFLKNFSKAKYLKTFFIFLIPIAIFYAALWLFAIFGQFFLEPKDIWQINLAVTRRNLILPSAMFLSIPAGTIFVQLLRSKWRISPNIANILLVLGFFTVTLVGGLYFSNKFIPMAPKKFIFPDHLIFDWLQENAGLSRFYGQQTAYVDRNFPTHYEVFGIEGYDTLRLKRYAELLASSFTGNIPKSYLRSDGAVPNEENGSRRRLFELLGVKYLLDKEDTPKTGADWHFERFIGDQVTPIWQRERFQLYERGPVLPRVFLTTKYLVVSNDQEIIKKIYDPQFNLQTLILEEEPPIKIENYDLSLVVPEIIKYQPNEVIIKTNLDYNSLLFLSDAHSRDWNVYVDANQQPLLRAHYALRSVAVPKGIHQVVFKYQPKSVTVGFWVTGASFVIIFVSAFYFAKNRRF